MDLMSKKIVVRVDESVFRRHTANSRLSHFEGEERELVQRVENAIVKGAVRLSHKVKEALIIEIDPAGFYTMNGAERHLSGWVKPLAVCAEVCVLHDPAAPGYFTVIDMQAWAVRHLHLAA